MSFSGSRDYINLTIALNTFSLSGDLKIQLKTALSKLSVQVRSLRFDNSTVAISVSLDQNGTSIGSADALLMIQEAAKSVMADFVVTAPTGTYFSTTQAFTFEPLRFNYPSQDYTSVLVITLLCSILMLASMCVGIYLKRHFGKYIGSLMAHMMFWFPFTLHLAQVIIAYISPISNLNCISQFLFSWVSNCFILG
jgi:hypothetical protein